jgi:hypothetical protein
MGEVFGGALRFESGRPLKCSFKAKEDGGVRADRCVVSLVRHYAALDYVAVGVPNNYRGNWRLAESAAL